MAGVTSDQGWGDVVGITVFGVSLNDGMAAEVDEGGNPIGSSSGGDTHGNHFLIGAEVISRLAISVFDCHPARLQALRNDICTKGPLSFSVPQLNSKSTAPTLSVSVVGSYALLLGISQPFRYKDRTLNTLTFELQSPNGTSSALTTESA